MRPGAVVAWTIGATLFAAEVVAQTRPDLSGRWAAEPPAPVPSAREVAAAGGRAAVRPVDLGSGWGRTITITQDAKQLTVVWPIYSTYDMQPPLQFVYALDGSETVSTLMLGRGAQALRSRASWVGDTLVITTVHSFADPRTGRTVTSQVRQGLALESPSSLVVLTTRSGALGGPSSTSRTVYTKEGAS
jgi:hypothetical protein